MFKLHSQLAQDTTLVTALSLCQILLVNDSRFPWLILVPQVLDLKELHDLLPNSQLQLMVEITLASRVLEKLYAPDKLNVGILGNIVEQLHIHVVARNHTDKAWPGPVWGQGAATPYIQINLEQTRKKIKATFSDLMAP